MGLSMPYLLALDRAGAIAPGRCAILDLGVSHLFNASVADILHFFEKYPKEPLNDRLRAVAADLAERTVWAHPRGQTFLAEVFAHTSVRYEALDIFPGPSTRVFDLNFDPVPADVAGRIDLVLNFGTTEHVFGQFNAFKVIHDALKVGGHVHHQLPSTGFFNHGYFKYHPRVFGELAAANGYDIVDLYVSEPQGFWSFEESYTPPEHMADPSRFRTTVKELAEAAPTHANGLINAVLRKTSNAPFRLALERATAPGGVTDPLIARRYGPPTPGAAGWDIPAPPAPVRRPPEPVRLAKWILRNLGVKRALKSLGLR